MLTTSKSGKSGKAAISQPSFFVQYFPLQNPLNPRELQMHVLPDSGIPMRDYFAARAIETAWQESIPTPTGKPDFDDVASKAYAIADAMLKAREAFEPYPQNLDEFQDAK